MGLGSLDCNNLQWAGSVACVAAYITCSDQFRCMDSCRNFRLEKSEVVSVVDDLLGIIGLIANG